MKGEKITDFEKGFRQTHILFWAYFPPILLPFPFLIKPLPFVPFSSSTEQQQQQNILKSVLSYFSIIF